MTYTPQHVYDAIPSRPDRRDYRMMAVDIANLPDHAQLPAMPVLNQGREGSCVGHGCAGAREVLEVIQNGAAPVVPLSRAFIYYMARKYENSQDQDSGAEVRDGCRVLHDIGVVTEDLSPYRVGGFADVPPDADFSLAARYKIITYTRLTGTLQARAALANGNPVVIGVAVYESFETQIGADGRVPLPINGEQMLGGHCMYLRVYEPDPQNLGRFLFTCVNSWGDGWADHGVCHVPQSYLDTPSLCSDLWSLSLT